MAVTTSVSSTPQYMAVGGNLPNCIGGGEDYRTVNNNTTQDDLYIRGWVGDNISNACLITSISITGCYCKITNTSGGYATAFVSGQVSRGALIAQGSVSGTSFTPTSGTGFGRIGSFINVARNSTTAVSDINNIDMSEAAENNRQANKTYPGVRVSFKSSDHIRMYIKWITVTVTRTRACYITFKGDSITEKTTMYDYDTVPSYGSTPSRDGYNFKGWSNGSTTYSGTLPTAYEQDVTYTAVWEKIRVPCTITYNGNGATGGSVSAQSGYIGESLTLSENDFTKRYIVEFEKNYIGGMNIGYQESSGFFRGWYTAAEGGTKIGDGGASYTPTGNITLYAHWSEMQAITFPTPTRDSYTFLGWYTSAEGGTKIGDGGASYTPTGHITLYAHWKLNEITDIYIGTSILDVYIGTSKCDVYQGTTKIYG